jgi:hypothetical protein
MTEVTNQAPDAGICTQNAPSEEARRRADEACNRRLAAASPMFRPVLEKAYSGEASPRKAIKAFCLECVGYDRKAISDCTAPACPLWLYRPYQNEGAG